MIGFYITATLIIVAAIGARVWSHLDPPPTDREE